MKIANRWPRSTREWDRFMARLELVGIVLATFFVFAVPCVLVGYWLARSWMARSL